MLNFLYSWGCYRTLKTGLLLDFFFKRIILKLMRIVFFNFSLFFFDKFLIEYTTKFFFKINQSILFFFHSFFSYSVSNLLTIILINFSIIIIFILILIL